MHIKVIYALLLFVVLILEDEVGGSGNNSVREHVNAVCSTNSRNAHQSVKEAVNFMHKMNTIDLKLSHDVSKAAFDYETNLTECNKNIFEKANSQLRYFLARCNKKANQFDWKSFEQKNVTLYRWFQIFSNGPSLEAMQEPTRSYSGKKVKTQEEIFRNAKICPYGQEDGDEKDCSLIYEPDLMRIMSKSRNPSELKYIWKEFRDATGRKMRNLFIPDIKKRNNFAKNYGFSDYSDYLINQYESEDFVNDMAQVMEDILPLYKQFHAYVRRKLIQFYGKNKSEVTIREDGPIPAHLVGNMYAQVWLDIFDIVNPYPEKNFPNVTDAMLKKKMTALDMFVMAENFFLSIGLERMTPYFWAGSVIEKPRDREMVCHAFATDFFNGKEFRIRQCTEITERSLQTVHHEMGHIEYYMLYKHLPKVFRDGANPGFHEAVGDVTSLSATTLDYLKKMRLIDESFEESGEMDIIRLVKVALTYLPTAPYAFIVDYYRYQIYNGSIPTSEINKYWWKYRLEYQGVCPPVSRSERDFDPGAKYHVAYSVGFMRYFFANVFEFQIYQALCQKANHRGPLHKCNIFNNKEAGDLLKKLLMKGKSVHWKQLIKMMTGKASGISSSAYLEYFQPLLKWLKKQNEGEYIGWKSNDPMSCPTE